MRHKGFSVVELLVALGIIVMISLVAFPLFLNYQKITKLRSEARILATNLRLAQQLAITEQTIYNLQFFSISNSYQIINSESSKIIKNITFDSEISINEIDSFINDTVQFTSTGGVIETGYVILINSKSDTSTIQVKPSGYVEINE